MNDSMGIKFNEAVWHDTVYMHPQLRKEVGPDFFDRTQLKTMLKAALRDKNSSLLIFQGERRAGKSSLLRLLQHNLAHDPAQTFLPLFVPWQTIFSRADLADEILRSSSYELDVDLSDEMIEDSIASDAGFVATLQELTAVSGKTIVICIDEFDSILEHGTDAEQAQILALVDAVAQAEKLPVKFLLTLVRLPACPADHAMAQVTVHRLAPFSQDDLNEMVSELMAWRAHLLTPDVRAELFRLSGGWPYFAKLLMVCLAEAEPGEGWFERALQTAVAHPLLEHSLSHIYFRHFNEAEKAVVLFLAARGMPLSAAEWDVLPSAWQTAVFKLVQRHYLTVDNTGGYQFCIGLLADWFPQWIRYEEEVQAHIDPKGLSDDMLNYLKVNP
ncbi:MAG: ATP-binding protein [Anaerolineales bacterium]|nr:ATP-binding protein [Anaerolineales bacterium]